MSNPEVFKRGDYHRAREKDLSNSEVLRHSYRDSLAIIQRQGWRNPFSGSSPTVLQMGIEEASTAAAFSGFVRDNNPQAQLIIADLSAVPLKQSSRYRFAHRPGVGLLQADTTNLPFADQSIDLIETDGLLQFLSPDEKIQTLKEWNRILKPEGIVTTRDRFIPKHKVSKSSTREYFAHVHSEFARVYGTTLYDTVTEDMRAMFVAQGFDLYMQPEKNPLQTRPYVYQVVARKL